MTRSLPRIPDDPAPRLYTCWRDRRDGTVVEVHRVSHWNRRFALLPPGGHGSLRVEVARGRQRPVVRRLEQGEFVEHFDLVYDPYTGWDAEVLDGG